MSSHWMKQTLIVSVLTVLITLPAAAQQRRLQGLPKPAGGTPKKLEVPPKLRPIVQRAIRATQQLQKARLEGLQVVKQLHGKTNTKTMPKEDGLLDISDRIKAAVFGFFVNHNGIPGDDAQLEQLNLMILEIQKAIQSPALKMDGTTLSLSLPSEAQWELHKKSPR